jgi:hypothetical protein
MRRCPACRGECGGEITDDAGEVRWIVCSGCSGNGEIEDEAPEPKLPGVDKEEEPPTPLTERVRDDVWISGILASARKKVSYLLPRGPDTFESLFVDHHPPYMERLYLDDVELALDPDDPSAGLARFRIVLHRIMPMGHPTEGERAILEWRSAQPDYHSHSCLSAVEVLEGGYEHRTGRGDGHTISTRLSAGSQYAMTDPREWHSVQPWRPGAYTLMVQGRLFPQDVREPPRVEPPPLQPLRPRAKIHLWWNMCRIFGVQPDDA